MVIGVDAGALGIKDPRLKVGTYQLTKNLILNLSLIDKTNEYLLFSFYPFEKDFTEKLGSNFKPIIFKPSRGFFQIRLPLEFIFKKIDLYLALNQALPWFHPFKIITFIHDLAFINNPECYPDSHRSLTLNTKNAIVNSDKIIVPSKAVYHDLLKFYKPNKKIIKVIYEGGGSNTFQETKMDIKKYQPYFLYVGSFKRIKNIPNLIKAFSGYLKASGENYHLIMAGSDYWLDPEILKTIKKEKITNKVINLGFVSDSQVNYLLKNARAFLSPSLYEGFGLTLVEAMKKGCPVIAGNLGGQKEIVGKAGILVNPKDVKSIIKALSNMENESYRKNLIKKGLVKVKEYSWEKFAKKFYQEMAQTYKSKK